MGFNMCNPIKLFIWTIILYYTTCYEQLVFTNITKVNSSSTFTAVDYVGSAEKTIDKNFNQKYSSCMHTATGKKRAWLQLDLGDIYNLKSVKIWYRNDRNTERLQGFLVLTTHSLDTSLDDNNLCYEDPKNGTLDTIIEVECTQTAQYVTIYKEDENEAILEICEVEIYGCPLRRYGANCVPCDTCKFDCDITGQCDGFGCVNTTRYLGPYCKKCRSRRYGKECKEECGYCKGNESCHHINGSCPGSCEPGYHGDKCITACSFGRYGDGCKRECGHCANNETCHHINGSCPGLCEVGYEGKKCLTMCKSRRYGKECKEECGHCKGNEPCNHINGSCPGLCEPGYHGEKCLTVCKFRRYGKECKEECGHCKGNEPCNHINGSCPGLCEPGYHGEKCLTECQKGLYGKKCALSCGHCLRNATCNHVNGSCPRGYCEPGWEHTKEKRCDQECNDGTFGLYCLSNCSGHCAGGLLCNKVNGSCTGGCKYAWINPYCNETCSPGRYGKDCQEKCGHCKNNKPCHHIDGSCSGLCKPGYGGERCLAKQLVQPNFTRADSSSVYHRYDGYPRKTVDGDFSQSPYTYCMLTAPGYTEAWLRIDLRKIFNIHSVKFWYRNDVKAEGYHTRRIQGFNIRLSNTTRNLPQSICYQDDGNTTLPPIIEKECEGVAQYVWIYTNKMFIDGVFLEICEVQVLGCSFQDSDGNCISCDQCKNDCEITGECDAQGCKKDGYRTPYCKECKRGRYGKDCNSSCGHCANLEACHNVTGSCPDDKCAPGWKYTKDWKCDKACSDGTFGENCSSSCSGHCAKGTFCSKTDGRCPSGCASGWESLDCSQRCSQGHYGDDCRQKCGKCEDNKTCDHINGSCNGLCEPGYKGEECRNTCKNGFYGRNCTIPCGHCAKNATCHHVTGSCPNGYCEPGWQNTLHKRCNKAINQKSECKSNQIVISSLYGVVAALFLCIFLNIFLIVRNAKKAFYGRRNLKMGNNKKNYTRDADATVTERIEESTGYQELGQLNNPSVYDGEEGNAGYQELGQLSPPSHYEELKRL